MISDVAAIILWDNKDTDVQDVVEKINLLKSAGFLDIILAATSVPPELYKIPGVTFLSEQKPMGSFKASAKAMRCFQLNKINKEVLLIFSYAPLNQRLLTRFLQITTIAENKPNINAFASVRVTRGTEKTRFKIDTNGYLTSSYKSSSGSQLCGLLFLRQNLLKHAFEQNVEKVSDFVSWAISLRGNIFAVIDGCCKDPYS